MGGHYEMWLFYVYFYFIIPFINATNQDVCGLGTAEAHSLWIADDFGRLVFPIFNQDALNTVPALPLSINETGPCFLNVFDRNVVCEGYLDYNLINSLRLRKVENFVVNNYNHITEDASPMIDNNSNEQIFDNYENDTELANYIKSQSNSFIELSGNSFKITGEIFSSEIGISMRLSGNIRPNQDFNGFLIDGDTFSNELRVGWKVEGVLDVTDTNRTPQLYLDVSTVGEGGWHFTGSATLQDKDGSWVWNVGGSVNADFLLLPLSYSGSMTTKNQEDKSWQFKGKTIVKPLLIIWSVEGAITPSVNEHITIPKGLFKGISIRHMLFRNSNFMGDFHKDALQGVINLETITFIDSKLEEIPRLDYFFKHVRNLKAIYLEQSSMPNINMGTQISLTHLQLLSFKGSGPLTLDGSSFSWLARSNLTYLNFQDCNINIADRVDAVLSPVGQTLRYLDLSYTSLTDETVLKTMLTGLKITHLSLAGLELTKVPTTALEKVSSTLKYLTLRRNNFRKVPEENMFSVIIDFPAMPELIELDLKRCNINFIETGAFDNLASLKKLYLSYNYIENVQEAWYNVKPGVVHIDLSYNGMATETTPNSVFSVKPGNGLLTLQDLEITDLSYSTFKYPDTVIQGLSKKTKELSLCYMNIQDKAIFQNVTLPDLNILDVSGNSELEFGSTQMIEFLHNLQKLEILIARNNRITNTLFTAFTDFMTKRNLTIFTASLKELILSENNIKSMSQTALSYFPNLNYLDLTENSIASWSAPILFNPNLKYLKISDNKIETITKSMVKDFSTLKAINIGRNPFQCDCNLAQFNERITKHGQICGANIDNKRRFGFFAINKYNGSINFPIFNHLCFNISDWSSSADYYCYQTNGEDMILLRNLSSTEFCQPEIILEPPKAVADLTALYITLAVIISLCLIIAFIYWKWWEIRMLTRSVRNAAILSFMDKNEDDVALPLQYSAFVSYSNSDRSWVLHNLLPRLENLTDVNICLHERDFQVGTSILENITQSMDKSRNLVVVLSQAFLKSQWCQFELQLAQHRLVESRRDKLLIVLLEPIPAYKKSKTLRYLMRTNTYLQWPGDHNAAEIERFWDRLLRSLAL